MVGGQYEAQLDEPVRRPNLFDHRRVPYPSSAADHTDGAGTVALLDESDVRTLLTTPPTEFVAARNALVKRLRKDKDRETATAVAAMRRPAWTDFALNVTSRDHHDDVEAFADAAAQVRDAQAAAIEGRAGPDVRATLQGLRDRTNALVKLANAALTAAGRVDDTPELLGRLSEVAGNADAIERLRRGALGTGGDDPDLDVFAGLEPAPATASPAQQVPSPPAPSRRETKTAPQPATEAPPVKAAQRRQLQRELDNADRQLTRSRRALREAESEASSAQAAVAAAERTLQLAQGRLAKARAKVEEATAGVDRDEAARDAAAAAVAKLEEGT